MEKEKHFDVNVLKFSPCKENITDRPENFTNILHPDDTRPLYQGGFKIREHNLKVKKTARKRQPQKIDEMKKYCEQEMPKNNFLRLANQHVEDTNKFLYYDFFYTFLYCQTQKVLHGKIF